MKYKTKKTLKTLALSVLGIGAIVGVCSGINTLGEKKDTDLKTIHPVFAVGGLNELGEFEDVNDSIYTINAFECTGLKIELDFQHKIGYKVFYYEEDGDFISSTDLIVNKQDLEVPLLATHARLEITPTWSKMDKEYSKIENQKIEWYEVIKYSSQLDVKVDKDGVIFKTMKFQKYDDEKGDWINEYYEVNYELGMTWEEFIDSDYNTISLDKKFRSPLFASDYSSICYNDPITDMTEVPKLSDVINPEFDYYFD